MPKTILGSLGQEGEKVLFLDGMSMIYTMLVFIGKLLDKFTYFNNFLQWYLVNMFYALIFQTLLNTLEIH